MYLIVGCGLSGSVIAERLASEGKTVKIIDKRSHIGGNCYDYIDPETGILLNKYGAHIFHTNNERVWAYVNNFSKWKRWDHKVVASCDNYLVPVPANITTINTLLNENIKNSTEFEEWHKKEILSSSHSAHSAHSAQIIENIENIEIIENSEDMAISRIGYKLYKKLIEPYTLKQWNIHPKDLDKSVLERLPLRNDYNPNYFNDKYQALPEKGYTEFFKNLLNHKNIEIQLNTTYDHTTIETLNNIEGIEGIFYTGPIDSYFPFQDKINEKLEYRTIDFIFKTIKNMNYFQPNSVVNYPQRDIPYTRIVEYKHFLNQQSSDTVISYEFSKESKSDDDKYYPIPNKRNINLYQKYKKLADIESEMKSVYFIGRLANYKYFNMDEAILNALIYMDNLNYCK